MFSIKEKKTIFKVILVVVVFLIIGLSIHLFNIVSVYKSGTISHLVQEARTIKGILLFILLYSIRPLFVFLPASPMAAAAGALYGTPLGTVIVVISALISGTVGFFTARTIGKDYFDRISHHKILKIKTKIEEGTWASVIFLNFVGLPWDFVSIASGLSKIDYKHFLLGITISSIPQSFIIVALGNVLVSIKSINDLLQIKTLAVIIVVILGITLPHFIKRKIDKIQKV